MYIIQSCFQKLDNTKQPSYPIEMKVISGLQIIHLSGNGDAVLKTWYDEWMKRLGTIILNNNWGAVNCVDEDQAETCCHSFCGYIFRRIQVIPPDFKLPSTFFDDL